MERSNKEKTMTVKELKGKILGKKVIDCHLDKDGYVQITLDGQIKLTIWDVEGYYTAWGLKMNDKEVVENDYKPKE